LETASNLEGIVDPPLETGKSTNHDDTGTKTSPETIESNSGVDLTNSATLLVHDTNHSVGGVRHNSAENTSPVTSHECDHELEVLGVGFTRCSENVRVEESYGSFESDELHNSVGDLSAPERNDTLVEEGPATLSHHLGPAFSESLGEGALISSLDSNFDSFEGAKRDISDEFGAGGGDSETNGLVLGSVFGTDDTLVNILENFVETELAEALSTVSDEGGEPAVGETFKSLGSVDDFETIGDALVHSGVSLFTALDNIEGANSSVSETAGEDTASHAFHVVRSVVNVRHVVSFSTVFNSLY